ncbi:MAG: DUF308 domain-containing protein [Candidatus Euphemobacter frigidus]|nr:DUF308 domain-containing protein [Candidatus Euphemobacter frigidus]MDP8275225.1 DUF308 domain-containing protein [Candidatus Euphemobacter frigidus]
MNEVVIAEKNYLTRHWWALAIRGIVVILLGLILLIWPGLTAEALILIFGIYFLAHGIFTLFTAADLRKEDHRGSIVLGGLISIAAGIFLLCWPATAILITIWIIAFWALITGIFEISAVFQLPRATTGKWLLFLSGLLSIIIGLILLTRPGVGLLAVIWLIGIYAIIAGITLLGLAARLRGQR